ncbi:MAG: hypothetical protein FWC00_05275 [Firmicutes bacterium]|nr:hypothetical protein [Bacillota bacterium]
MDFKKRFDQAKVIDIEVTAKQCEQTHKIIITVYNLNSVRVIASAVIDKDCIKTDVHPDFRCYGISEMLHDDAMVLLAGRSLESFFPYHHELCRKPNMLRDFANTFPRVVNAIKNPNQYPQAPDAIDHN